MDTEAKTSRHDGGETQTWRLGVTSIDQRKRDWDKWTEPEFGIHDTPDDLWHWIDCRIAPGARAVLVAHNLAYDLRISRAFTILPARGWTLERIRPDGEQTFARWRNGSRSLVMIDSLSWFKAPLEVIGDELGMSKTPLPDEAASRSRWVQRCYRDVEILRVAWLKVIHWLHDADLGTWQPTGAGQAWSAWRHKHYTHPILCGDDEAIREMERGACWTGRAEAWRHGRYSDGPYQEYDVQLAYLRIMRDCDIPTRQLTAHDQPAPADVKDWMRSRAVLAVVDVETDVPVVPMQGPKGILWPVGRFTTTLWDPELRLLQSVGARITYRRVATYAQAPALASFAEWLWPMASGEAPDCDPIIHRVAKHWSRALIGRFGVRYATWEPYGEALPDAQMLGKVVLADTGKGSRMLTIGADCLRESGMVEGDNAAPFVLGWVMSETRRRLWATMQRAGLAHVLACDTDGLLVDREGATRLATDGHAGVRLKATYRSCEVIAPRMVVYDGSIRAPGIPRRSRQTGPRTFTGTNWEYLSTALSTGRPDQVVIKSRTVTLKGTDRRRQHLDDGLTAPYRVDCVTPA